MILQNVKDGWWTERTVSTFVDNVSGTGYRLGKNYQQ